MTKTLIIGDIHSRWPKFLQVLQRAGVIDDKGNRVDGFRIIQLGDAVSLGYGDKEKDFYASLDGWIDEFVIGNHELPAFWWNGNDMQLGFNGYEDRDREAEKLVQKRYSEGGYVAAASVGKWVITHAGIAPIYQKVNGYRASNVHEGMSTEEIVMDLNMRFRQCQKYRRYDPVISGRQMGGAYQGIFWLRIWHLQNGYGAMHIPQIVGHTPHVEYAPKQIVEERLWCIDSPPVHDYMHGGVVGLLTEDDGENFEVIYEP